MLELLLAGPSGGVLGLLGHFGKRWFAMKESAQNHKHQIELAAIEQDRDRARFEHEQILHKQSIEAADRDREFNLNMAAEKGSREGLIAATGADIQAGEDKRLWPATVNLRAAMRPLLALLFLVLMAVVFLTMRGNAEIVVQVVAAIIFCTTTALTFYFGERPTRAIRDFGAK